MGPLGVPELIFIFVLALLIFGPKKLPQLGKTFGKSMAEFRRASNDLRSTFQREMDAIDRENQEVKDIAQEVKKDFDSSVYFEDGEDDSYDYEDTSYPKQSSSSSSADSQKSSDNKTAKTAGAAANGVETAASAVHDGTPLEGETPPTPESAVAAKFKT